MMRILFAGTPEFAAPCLRSLIESQHEILAVYTQPDRPAGRGQRLKASPIKQLALAHRIKVEQPASLRTPSVQQALADLQADVMIVVAYGLMIPAELLNRPKLGCINVHASLLPRWRGAAPIQRAILAGDTETGITIMQMEAGLDTGDILNQARCAMTPEDTTQTLQTRLATLGAQCLNSSLQRLPALQAVAIPQIKEASCYATKIRKAEGLLNWQESASRLSQRIRAFNPWPVAFTFAGKLRLRVWYASVYQAEPNVPSSIDAGTVVAITPEAMIVITGDGYLSITQLQLEGRQRLALSALLNTRPTWLQPGTRLGA